MLAACGNDVTNDSVLEAAPSESQIAETTTSETEQPAAELVPVEPEFDLDAGTITLNNGVSIPSKRRYERAYRTVWDGVGIMVSLGWPRQYTSAVQRSSYFRNSSRSRKNLCTGHFEMAFAGWSYCNSRLT